MKIYSFRGSLAVASFVVMLVSQPVVAQVRSIKRISDRPAGTSSNGDSSAPSVGSQGKYVAFQSTSDDLVSGDHDGVRDVFLRDVRAGTVEQISTGLMGADPNGASGSLLPDSRALVVTPDGRYVTFVSEANNLVNNDFNEVFTDVFIRDRQSGVLARASLPENEAFTVNQHASNPGLSYAGDIVTFESIGQFVSSNDNSALDVYTRDLLKNDTFLVSGTADFTEANGPQNESALSGDGNWVVFSSFSTDLDPADSDSISDVFLRNRTDRSDLRLISINPDSVKGNSSSGDPAVNVDGTVVAYVSTATNLLPAATVNGKKQIYVLDFSANSLTLVTVLSNGTVGDGDSYAPVLSADGRYVGYLSDSTNLVPGDTNGVTDAFVFDRFERKTYRASVNPTGTQVESPVKDIALSPEGTYAAFSTADGNLLPDDLNGLDDVFLVEIGSSLTKQTTIDLPPVVESTDSSATVFMQNFNRVNLKQVRRQFAAELAGASKGGAKPKPVIRWNLTLMDVNNSPIRKKISKKNIFTFKNLPPGNYSTSYRVIAKRGNRTIVKTNQSPAAPFTVG